MEMVASALSVPKAKTKYCPTREQFRRWKANYQRKREIKVLAAAAPDPEPLRVVDLPEGYLVEQLAAVQTRADLAEHLEAIDRRILIDRALNLLRERDRRVLSMYFLESYTMEEIGRLLVKPVRKQMIEIIIKRALRRLATPVAKKKIDPDRFQPKCA